MLIVHEDTLQGHLWGREKGMKMYLTYTHWGT